MLLQIRLTFLAEILDIPITELLLKQYVIIFVTYQFQVSDHRTSVSVHCIPCIQQPKPMTTHTDSHRDSRADLKNRFPSNTFLTAASPAILGYEINNEWTSMEDRSLPNYKNNDSLYANDTYQTQPSILLLLLISFNWLRHDLHFTVLTSSPTLMSHRIKSRFILNISSSHVCVGRAPLISSHSGFPVAQKNSSNVLCSCLRTHNLPVICLHFLLSYSNREHAYHKRQIRES